MDLMYRAVVRPWAGRAVWLCVLMVVAQAAWAASITVRFNDGKEVTYDLPQGMADIEAITVSAGKAAAAPLPGVTLKEVTLSETFDAGLGDRWAPTAAAGGNFERFARLEKGKVLVAVPAGNSWGKTGVRTTKPVFTMDDTMTARPMQIVLDFDPEATNGYIVAIAPESSPDVVHAMQSWFHWCRNPKGEAGMYLRNFRTGQVADLGPNAKYPPVAPRQVAFSVSPGKVEVAVSSGEKLSLPQAWLVPGTPVFVHVHSHPGPEGDPAGFALDTVTIGR